jgi:hypothetical protein
LTAAFGSAALVSPALFSSHGGGTRPVTSEETVLQDLECQATSEPSMKAKNKIKRHQLIAVCNPERGTN